MNIEASAPDRVSWFWSRSDEQMNYLYLPVAMRECDTGVAFRDGIRLEERLEPFIPFLHEAWSYASRLPEFDPRTYYCYLSAKNGFATTENPLNRPGWHIDAWGHPEDHNFVWVDRFPTRYITGPVSYVPSEDAGALAAFERAGRQAEDSGTVQYVEEGGMYYFHQQCIHATPIIEQPGMRQFVKVSLSPHRYNLKGNSKNYRLVYDWAMADRHEFRNDPVAGNGDFA